MKRLLNDRRDARAETARAWAVTVVQLLALMAIVLLMVGIFAMLGPGQPLGAPAS